MNLNYQQLLSKSTDIETLLQKKSTISKINAGRFKEYQKEIEQLVSIREKLIANNEKPIVEFGGKQVLALKELREIIEVLEPLLNNYDALPENSKKIVKDKVGVILTGATYTINEGKNTTARDFQFEFRLAAKFFEAGYKVYFMENPDIVIEIKGRRYAVECKRITGKSVRSIQSNIESAVEQLILHKDYFYAGIVALDVSALLDNRENILTSHDREIAGQRILDDMQKMLFRDYDRYQMLKKYSATHLVALFYNFSGSYSIPNTNDVGWAQGTGVLEFSENKKRMVFAQDFKKYKNNGSME